MEELNRIEQYYLQNISITNEKLDKNKRNIYLISIIRLFLFILGVIGIIYCWSSGWEVIAIAAIITFVPFFILVKKHNTLFYRKEYLEKLSRINKQELEAINGDTSSFEDGHEFIDDTHLYSYDLDLFGKLSLFQCINRTSTQLGKNTLASWFMNHLDKKKNIETRQEAVKELAPKIKLRQEFRILGLLYAGTPTDEGEIVKWAQSPSYFRSKTIFQMLPAIVFVTNVVLVCLTIANIIPSSISGMIFVSFILSSFIFSKKITKLQVIYGKRLQILGTYAKLIRTIEQAELQSSSFKEIKKLIHSEQRNSSEAIRDLSKLMNQLDRRNNIIIAMVLNGLFFWELRQIMKIENWKESYAEEMPKWLEAIGKMDALCSLATFAYNHPDYTYPQINSSPSCIKGEKLGHPLMNRDKCVKNDLTIEKQPFFIIVTGANMAGKSTYLRTVGINYLLACIGSPVCASQMEIHPAKLITCLHTSDSLTGNESYFFAELKRLKLIIDKLNANEDLFIILDEILKGTNSVDKQKGSLALIKQFMSLQTNGIIATHDLALSSLQNSFPNNIRNYCFEADINNDELIFSYKMKEGVAENMNACFLMKKMGIAVVE
ncbi:MutS-related protein [Bacteroides ihuae]|uniref:MutS-related protein n=1 Tax=Bacteroides ihuae TaxID=1852362 RepID=UPI0008D9A7F5|nr:MutS family DNA mismatch repair protein [Bacteroides ihuae]